MFNVNQFTIYKVDTHSLFRLCVYYGLVCGSFSPRKKGHTSAGLICLFYPVLLDLSEKATDPELKKIF